MIAFIFIDKYPLVIALVFVIAVIATPVPSKGLFVARAATALVIAVLLAHLNRMTGFWQAHLIFPSGHTTFCAGLTWSLAMLRPWTLFFTIPLLIAMGVELVLLGFHCVFDIWGAFPLVIVIYGMIHACWRLPGDPMLTDR